MRKSDLFYCMGAAFGLAALGLAANQGSDMPIAVNLIVGAMAACTGVILKELGI